MDAKEINKIVEWLDVDLIKSWHLLFTGADGTKTYGITVRSRRTKEELEDMGYCRAYPINDYTLDKYLSMMEKEGLN